MTYNEFIKAKQQFCTITELIAMGVVPFRNRLTVIRKIDAGEIETVRNNVEGSKHFIPREEVIRLKQLYTRKSKKSV